MRSVHTVASTQLHFWVRSQAHERPLQWIRHISGPASKERRQANPQAEGEDRVAGGDRHQLVSVTQIGAGFGMTLPWAHVSERLKTLVIRMD